MLETRHFGMDAEIQCPRMANLGRLHCQNEALVKPAFTVHGLDIGIHADMTALWPIRTCV